MHRYRRSDFYRFALGNSLAGVCAFRLIVLCLIAVFAIVSPAYALGDFLSYEYWSGNSPTTSRSEVFRNIGLVVVAIVALAFGIWRSYISYVQSVVSRQQIAILDRGQITDRYTEAVKMLGSEKMRERVGAVYALGRIASDSIERDHLPVMEVLCEFVRNNPHENLAIEKRKRYWELDQKYRESPESSRGIRPDLKPIKTPDLDTIFNVLENRSAEQLKFEKSQSYKLDFSNATLSVLDIKRVFSANSRMRYISADYSRIMDSDFSNCDLCVAQLNNAAFSRSNFTNANLEDAILYNAVGPHCSFIRANFKRADLKNANLHNSDFLGANFEDANIENAYMADVKNLTQEQIEQCRPSKPPRSLPDNLIWPFEE